MDSDHPIDDDEYRQIVGTHKPGSIVRIELRNFLTHGHAIIKPGPRLNMVVGANGTGKSTILNAICLGLGGDPKLLGRADDLREFIMHEKDMAEVVIELENFPDKERHVIRRVIDRNKGSERGRGRGASSFYINNEKCKTEDVRDLVSNVYGISIDNLCTFLPQDKVGNFSGLSDQNRLIETEKALSKDSHYYHIHQKLIEHEAETEQSVLDVDSIQSNLNKLLHEFERLEREKHLAEEREKALRQVELLKMKKVWLEFEQIREEAITVKQERDEIKVKIKEAKHEIQPLEERYEQILAKRKEMESRHKSLDQSTQRCVKEIEKQETKFEKHDDEIETIMAKLNEIDSKRAKLQEQLRVAQERLQELEAHQQSLPPKEQTEAEYEDAVVKMKEIRKDFDVSKRLERATRTKFKEAEDDSYKIQQKLTRMNDDTARRREKIFRERPNLGTIHEWIKKHGSNFRRPVTGPIATEIVTHSQQAAAYLEYHVANNILCSFVVETKEDYNLLYESVRNELKLPINVLLVPRINEVKRIYSPDKMKILQEQHGVECYLDEFFTAPEPVLQALRDYSSIDKVLVGSEKTQQSIDYNKLLDYLSEGDPDLGQKSLMGSCIFSIKDGVAFRYTQTVSRYSKQLGSRIDQVSPAKMLAKGVDPELKKATEEELEKVHQVIAELRPELLKTEQATADLEKELQEATLKVEGVKKAFESWTKFESKIERQRAKVEEAQHDLDGDESREKKELVIGLMGRLAHAIGAMETHALQHAEMIKHTIASAGITVTKTTLGAAERSAKNELDEMKEMYKELEERATEINRRFTEMKQLVTKKKREADAVAPLTDENGNDLPLKDELSQLEVDCLVEVDAAIEEIERSIEGIHDNPDAIRQYEKLKTEIEGVKATLENVTGSRERRVAMLETMRQPWEAALEKYTQKVNSLFTKYMAEVGCTGEVRLKKACTTEGDITRGNFKDWGMEILVSFREGAKAQVLSAERHSGGERSVSTILYLMALQDLMVAPFRCVDEINQGLDDRNERLVFKRIVANSTKKPTDGLTDHSGQYFLITPKLLPNLTDMEEHGVTILFVYNGIYNFKDPDELDFAAIANDYKDRSVADDADKENVENIPRRKGGKKRKS